MISRLGHTCARWAQALVPDPMVFAIGLTGLTFALAWALTPSTALHIVEAWAGPRGVFHLLAFGMQMSLILVTGHVLASSAPVGRALSWMAGRFSTPRALTALVAAVAVMTGLINWGLGLIVGALFAREVGRRAARRGIAVHYPLLAAAGYTGLMVWHGGFSGSAPLTVTRMSDLSKLLGPQLAAQIGEISLQRTLLGPLNIVVAALLLLLVPVLCALLLPALSLRQSAREFVDVDAVAAPAEISAEPPSIAGRLNRSRTLVASLVALIAFAAWMRLRGSGLARLDLNSVILIFWGLGLALQGSVRAYLVALSQAIGGTAGIVIQFPLYAGIMGMMAGSGLVEVFAQGIVSLASATTYPLLNFASAAWVNFFVPSGGGQWAVQGPISVKAALSLGVPVERAVMSLAYGDQLTNMLQPFWAIPLLGITGVKAHHVIGYTTVIMLLSAPIFVLALWLL